MISRKETRKPLEDEKSAAPDDRSKKAYTAPRLTIYGSIEKLTKTGGRTTKDGGGGRKKH